MEGPSPHPAAEDAAARDDAPQAPRRRKFRALRWITAIGVVLIMLIVFAIRTPSPVGHWDGAEGQDTFRQAYDTAFTDLPEPAATLDVRTDYGVVRVYRFAGTGNTQSPFVLLPGRSSVTPIKRPGCTKL